MLVVVVLLLLQASRALPGCAGHAPGSGCHRGGAQLLEELLVQNMGFGCREYAGLCARHVSCRSNFSVASDAEYLVLSDRQSLFTPSSA